MAQKKSLPKLVVFGVLTAVTAFMWVGFEIYRAFNKTPEPVVSPEVLQTLDSDLDKLILEGLVNKVYLEDGEIGKTTLLSPSIEIVPTEEEILLEELELPEEIATESGQI